MTHLTTLFALVVGGMEVIQPTAAGVLAVSVDVFQRRQTTGNNLQLPSQCEAICEPINAIISHPGNCPPSKCCLATFETSYFNCFVCISSAANMTDYSKPQSIIDTLYGQCASLGLSLPTLTFPGQNPNRTLSSLASSQTHPATVTLISIFTVTALTSPTATTQAASPSNTPTPTLVSLSSGIRSVETNCFDRVMAGAMMLGTWFYFMV